MYILNARIPNPPYDLVDNGWSDVARKAAIEARKASASAHSVTHGSGHEGQRSHNNAMTFGQMANEAANKGDHENAQKYHMKAAAELRGSGDKKAQAAAGYHDTAAKAHADALYAKNAPRKGLFGLW